ncbi:MAG: CRISPR-associated protein Cas2 [Saprospiraceae bacterium]|jgi:CRISPR-associated protein Cas2
MITWVMYDIENDKARSKVAKYCKLGGLYRVQFFVSHNMKISIIK